MNIKNATLVLGTALVLAVAGCSSDSDSGSSTTEPTATAATGGAETPAGSESCPTAPANADATPQWTEQGTTGSLQMVASTATQAPDITVENPFSVDATQVKVLVEGDGAVVPETASVAVCYVGVNGRTGETFDSAYANGSPATFPLDGVIPGFSKAIAGQKVGSKVGVAMTSADGYASGNPQAGIEVGDTLVFEISILSAS
ncbi:FKBP-type peptidyl-prolyl cis-trans isomerase [Gordonia sp. KTR9]|uniref:FKBP-type peptidyl-prolyl cis-trans isomerase n=1 Tax=Gordonia sp. KTR9 TaxID=337191 RepID=UPI00027DE0B4|nr:FKBP-type peptidyl-prolyl cis-trans isomerase [Gordonia sp. KTR9]AFR49052.1 FKBP-type peptidyl-prolyl cis-trans isomerases 1 [Gordonia sp. KTR9]